MEPVADGLEADLVAREAIRERLCRLARAVDRRDFRMLEKPYWPDAVETHGAFDRPIAQFFDWLRERTAPWERTMFSLGQSIIDLRVDQATVETYFTAFRKKPTPDGAWHDEFVAGRYLELMTKRRAEWRVQRRTVVFEWYRQFPDSAGFAGSPFGAAKLGERWPHDPVYTLFPEFSQSDSSGTV